MSECAHVLVHIFGSPESQDCLNGVQKLTISWYAKARQGLCTRGAGPKLGDQKQRRADTGEAQEKQRRAGRGQLEDRYAGCTDIRRTVPGGVRYILII